MIKRMGLAAFLMICPIVIHAAAITINTSSQRLAISPYIYGTNQQMEGDENLTCMRLGGNRMTGYNWENNASNSGIDDQPTPGVHSHSDDYMCNAIEYPLSATECANTAGGVLEHFIDYNIAHGYKSVVTLPMAGYVAADKDATFVTAGETAPSARWKQVVNVKGSTFAYPPNLADNFVYADEEMWHLMQKYGNALAPNGVIAYQLDNEPDLWKDTHPRIHPTPVGAAELVTRSIPLATSIKNVDPNAMVFGPVFGMIWSEDNLRDPPDWAGIKSAGGYNWYVDYFLDKMSEAEVSAGKRLLDAIDIHYYSESREGLYPPYSYSPPTPTPAPCRITEDGCNSALAQLSRLQSARSLWDPAFIENSSVGQWQQANLPLLPKVQTSIDTYYPGTKIVVTEHGFGGGTDYSGGICVADVLGIFGKYNVYLATMWKSGYGIFHSAAYKLYRNYNGTNGTYGDTKVQCDSNDIPNMTTYASINGTDDSVVHIIVLNKAATAQTANVSITSPQTYTTGEAWAFGGAVSAITQRTAPSLAGNSFSYSVPAHSAFHFIIRSGATPTNTPNWTATRTRTPTTTWTNTPNWTATPTVTATATVPVTILNTCDSLTYNGTLIGGGNSTVSINTTVPAAITEGAGSFKINITATADWNDGIMSCNGITTTDWSGYETLTLDVYVDPANLLWLPASGWHELQLFVNTSNGKDYRKISIAYGIASGINHLTIVLNPALDTDPHPLQTNTAALAWTDPIKDYFFVLNSDGANVKTGVFYMDNLVLHSKAATATPTSTVTGTYTSTHTATRTYTPTPTATRTTTDTPTRTFTRTVTLTRTETLICSPTETITGTPPTETNTPSITMTETDTSTETYTPTDTGTATPVDTNTNTPVNTQTRTVTITTTPTLTPTRTYTLTITNTRTPGPVNTPTPTRTVQPSGEFDITDVLAYPNPVQAPGAGLIIKCNVSRMSSYISVSIYTMSFRKIKEVRHITGLLSGDNEFLVDSTDINGLSNGVYYYVVSAADNGKNRAASGTGKFVIVR